MPLENEQTVPPRAGRREWIGLAVIALPCLLYSMDLTVLYLAVPSLTKDLEPSSAQLLWITDIYAGFSRRTSTVVANFVDVVPSNSYAPTPPLFEKSFV